MKNRVNDVYKIIKNVIKNIYELDWSTLLNFGSKELILIIYRNPVPTSQKHNAPSLLNRRINNL
jgi:hypothetical protein